MSSWSWPTRSASCTWAGPWPRVRRRRLARMRWCKKSIWAGRNVLRVTDVHTYYGKSHILQGVSLEVRDGELVGILGRNGVGKTTLLKSILSLVPPRAGSVVFDDVELSGRPAHEIPRLGIGYVPQ